MIIVVSPKNGESSARIAVLEGVLEGRVLGPNRWLRREVQCLMYQTPPPTHTH